MSQLQHGYAAVTPVEAADLDLPDLAEAADAASPGVQSLADSSSKAGPAQSRTRTTSPGQVLAIVCVGIVLANLDLFIVNVGLPNIARDFNGATLEDMSWILNGYAIAYAALLVFFGRLAERHRRDLSFLLGVALFTAASAACAAGRQRRGAGGVSRGAGRGRGADDADLARPVARVVSARTRGGAVRTWTAIGGLAAALGPLIGGLLVTASWRWIFLVNVPIGVARDC